MIEHVARWMSASLFKSFNLACTGIVPVYVEGTDVKEVGSYLEIRVDGPNFEQMTSTFWCLKLRVHVLIKHTHADDLYKVERLIGTVVNALPTSIAVYKYGDDSSLVDCMRRCEAHKVHRYGKVAEKVKLTLASVETLYQLQVTT